jgi:ATP-dependent helicase HrpB
VLRQQDAGDILVFLAGAAEIRKAERACQPIAKRAGLLITPLYGDLSPAEQDRAVSPALQRKLILSTNVAESSITIEGVAAVIDSGLARFARHSPWTGLPSLEVGRISKASAEQRAGRAARTRPGRAIRLYPREDFERRHGHEIPEIARAELSRLGLETRALGLSGIGALPWFESTPTEAIKAADELLQRLGAIDAGGAITGLGREMSGMPLHPRLARLVAEATRRGAADDGCALAALLSAGDRLPNQTHTRGPSDLLFLLDAEWSPAAKRAYAQIRRRATPHRSRGAAANEHDETLLISILAAFPDRVARRKPAPPPSHKHTGKAAALHDQLLLANAAGAVLSPASVVRDAKLLVALDVEERSEQAAPLVRLSSAIEPEWLIDLFPGRVTERAGVEWNRVQERVDSVSALLYDDLVIEESRSGSVDAQAAAAMLAENALEAGIERLADRAEIDNLLARTAFAAEHGNLRALNGEQVRAALESLCTGLRGFADLRAAARNGGLLETLRAAYSPEQQRVLDRTAPERIQLPSGRRAKIQYEIGKPPWVASRLQDFFGLRDTPRVAAGAVPLVVHLLAPNNRPVQMTTDLAGFWQRLYPELRRQLSRRYPRHKWPEDPYTASLEPTGKKPREK